MAEETAKRETKITTMYDLPDRKISWLESFLGPELYRIVYGIFRNPLSVTGLVLIGFFVLIALFAPLIAPPLENTRDPYTIPRDGYSPIPESPGGLWEKLPPPLPFWWKPIMRTDQWTHLFGTSSGQWDIFYGVIWGTRTALKVGLFIVGVTVTIGVIVGSLAAYYGGILDEILMRIAEIFMTFPFLMAALTLSALLAPVMGKGLAPPTIALIVFGWMGYRASCAGRSCLSRDANTSWRRALWV